MRHGSPHIIRKISFHQTLAKYRSGDEKDNWERIPLSELNISTGGLCFFDAEGMRFHLPAYLIADLRGEYHFGMAFNLTHLSEHGMSQFSLLNQEQRFAVRTFLLHLLDDPDYKFDRDEIYDALIHYWTDDDPSQPTDQGDGDDSVSLRDSP